MTIEDIIKQYLKDNGFDGLCNPDLECGCGLDDLMPCGGEGVIDCEPAYRHRCAEHLRNEYHLVDECFSDCSGECFKRTKMEAK